MMKSDQMFNKVLATMREATDQCAILRDQLRHATAERDALAQELRLVRKQITNERDGRAAP